MKISEDMWAAKISTAQTNFPILRIHSKSIQTDKVFGQITTQASKVSSIKSTKVLIVGTTCIIDTVISLRHKRNLMRLQIFR